MMTPGRKLEVLQCLIYASKASGGSTAAAALVNIAQQYGKKCNPPLNIREIYKVLELRGYDIFEIT